MPTANSAKATSERFASSAEPALSVSNTSPLYLKDVRPIESLLLYEADFGFLEAEHSAVKYVEDRLKALLFDARVEDLPSIAVLGGKGAGINAMAFGNWEVVITPELLEFVESEEELDFVIMHEVVHLLRAHHEKIDDRTRAARIADLLGISRLCEYEADIVAFYKLSELGRNSNPIGAIRFLERLRVFDGYQCWEPVHGNLTDRILNLRGVISAAELDAGFNPSAHKLLVDLKPISTVIKGELALLREGGRLSYMIESLDRVESKGPELNGYLRQADLNLLRASLPNIASKTLKNLTAFGQISRTGNGFGVTEIKLENCLAALKVAIKRWDTLITADLKKKGYDGRAAELYKGIELSILLEEVLKVDELTNSFPPIKSITEALKNVNRDDLFTLISLVRSLGVSFNSEGLFNLVSELSHEAVGPMALFDMPKGKGIDIERYLDWSIKLLEAVKAICKESSFKSLEEIEEQCFATWSLMVCHLLKFLCDTGDLAKVKETELGKIDGSLAKTYVDELSAEFPESAAELTVFFREKLKLREFGISVGIEELMKGLRAYHAAHPEGDRLKESEYIGILREIAWELRAKPAESSLGVVDHFFGENPTLNEVIGYVRLLQIASSTKEQYQHELYELLSCLGTFQYDDLLNLIELSLDISGAERLFGVEASFKAICRDEIETDAYREELTAALLLKLKSHRDPEIIYQIINEHLKICRTRQSFEVDGNLASSREEIFNYCFSFINLKETPPSLKTKEFIFSLSFFINEQLLGQAIRNSLLPGILRELGLKDGIDFALKRFRYQGFIPGFEALEILDELASTPSDFSLLKSEFQSCLTLNGSLLSKAGEGVIFEGLNEYLLKKADRLELLNALIFSSKDERELQELIERGWWKTFGEHISLVIKNELLDVKAVGEMQEIKDLPQYLEAGTSDYTRGILTLTSPEEILNGIYLLGPTERYALLRSLLTGKNGVLGDKEKKRKLSGAFLSRFLREGEDPLLTAITFEVVHTLFKATPNDHLAVILTSLLKNKIANEPTTRGSWDDFSKERSFKVCQHLVSHPLIEPNLEEMRIELSRKIDLLHQSGEGTYEEVEEAEEELEDQLESIAEDTASFAIFGEAVRRRLLWFYLGRDPDSSPASLLTQRIGALVISKERDPSFKGMDPLQFAFEFGKHLDAPGTRMLQLLGQVVAELPASYSEQFLKIYDSRKGQMKISAFETIRLVLPDYATSLQLGERLGGGSLYTVYKSKCGDGTVEVVRVLNPNAWYQAKNTIEILKDTVYELEKLDKRYEKVRPLLPLVEEWIMSELQDESFEEDDVQYRESWNGYRPHPSFSGCIIIPESRKTGTSKIRREVFVEGRNLTELKAFAPSRRKEMVALATQHYMATLVGMNKDGALSLLSLVHSDISWGNLRATVDGNLALLDRGMYLKFDVNERLFLIGLSAIKQAPALAKELVQYLGNLECNRDLAHDLLRIEKELEQELAFGDIDLEHSFLRSIAIVQANGLKVPLKFSLLFKNLNAFSQMAREAGFKDLREALNYHPV